MKNYIETIEMMKNLGWSRVHETKSHIFFVRRMSNGCFERKTVEYVGG